MDLAVDLALGAAFVAAGVVVALAGPGRTLGLLTVAFGLAWSARVGLLNRPGALAAVAAAVPAGVLVHLVATLPTGRAVTRARRAAVAAGYLVVVPMTALGPLWARAPAWAGVLGLAVTGWVQAGAVRRRAGLPALLAAGPAAAGTALAPVAPVAAVLLLAWPVALLLGSLRSRLDRSAVADLVAELRVGAPTPAQLRAALARALHDPSVELVEQVPHPRDGRAVTPLERHGRRVGVLVHDPALEAEPELLRAVAAGAAIARENARLDAEIAERLREVEASRTRIVEAADAARAGVEHDLQDGVQQRLAVVALMLRLAGTRTADDPGGVPGVLDEAGRELAGALAALRELAGGLYPVILADAGLGPALESLAQRAAVPTVVASAPDGRLPDAVEQAGYFVVAEVLDRAARLDGVREVVVEAGVAGGRLRLRVTHDAVDPAPMQGPADRIGALDGELTVRRGPAGTTVAATVPVRADPPRASGSTCWDSITTGPILVPVPQLIPARAAGPARPVRAGATSVLAGARRGHPGLFWLAAALLALAVVSAVGLVVDDRVVLGAPVWAKPLKFALSFALYSLALAWMLSLVEHRRRTGAVLGWIIAVGSAVELMIITGQAARGVRSHFNEDSARDAVLFSIMGLTVAVIWVTTLALALVVLRRPSLDRPVASSIRLGLLVALLGMLVGVLMSVHGGHAVGVADGGAGVPLLGWSTVGGDLRVGHFVGMHALQVLPLLAAVLAVPQARQLPELVRLRLVRLGGAGYLGLLLVLVWQALRGQPLTAPDPVTLAALGALLVAGAAGAAVIVRRSGAEQPQG